MKIFQWKTKFLHFFYWIFRMKTTTPLNVCWGGCDVRVIIFWNRVKSKFARKVQKIQCTFGEMKHGNTEKHVSIDTNTRERMVWCDSSHSLCCKFDLKILVFIHSILFVYQQFCWENWFPLYVNSVRVKSHKISHRINTTEWVEQTLILLFSISKQNKNQQKNVELLWSE